MNKNTTGIYTCTNGLDLGWTPFDVPSLELLDGMYGLQDWIADELPCEGEERQLDMLHAIQAQIFRLIGEGETSGKVLGVSFRLMTLGEYDSMI